MIFKKSAIVEQQQVKTTPRQLAGIADILKCKSGTPRDYGDGTGRQSARVETVTVEKIKLMKPVQGTLVKVAPAMKGKLLTVKLKPSQIAFKSTEMKVVHTK